MSALPPLQRALVERWKSDPGVTALVGDRVFDGEARQGAVRPYLIVGAMTETPRNTFAARGFEPTVTTHAFSDYAGNQQLYEILAAAGAALAAPLDLDGHTAVLLKREFVTTLMERSGDRVVRHLVMRFRARVLEVT